MNMPGFTAEVSVYTANDRYHTPIKANQASGLVRPAQCSVTRGAVAPRIYPAQFLATHYSKVPIDFFQTFREPQCIKICLRGYCRWICF
jgi:hypothetical protein